MDTDGISLVCIAAGDPAPSITWVSPDGSECTTLPDPWDKDIFQVGSWTAKPDEKLTCRKCSFGVKIFWRIDLRIQRIAHPV